MMFGLFLKSKAIRFIPGSLFYVMLYISTYILISMPRSKTDYIRYVCNFTIKQYEALKDKSDEEGIPIAHQVRTAINQYIKN